MLINFSSNKYKCDNIAILMATYNGEKFIKDQIDSLLKQTYQDWTLFIHDDGSSDNTLEIIKKYEKVHSDKIVIVDAPSTGGAKYNFMFLLSLVEAPFVMFCDQDDVWLENKIKKTLDRMRTFDNDIPVLVYSELKVVNEELQEISSKLSEFSHYNHSNKLINNLLVENVVTGCTVMINYRLALLAQKSYDNSKILMHDWWIALVAAKFGVISFIDEGLILYRQHTNNTIGAQHFGFNYFFNKIIHINRVISSISGTRLQAKYMADVFFLDETDVISLYGRLNKKNKFSRILFIIKNKISKSGVLKNVAMLLLG